jgi:hypothetical protein
MDLEMARTRATISVPEAGQLLSLGRDASYAAAARGEIPTLSFGRRLRVPVARLLTQLGEPIDRAQPRPHGEDLDVRATENAEAEPSTDSATATIHAFERPKTGELHGGAKRPASSTT